MTRTATQAEREVFASTAALAEFREFILAGLFDDHPIMQAIQAFGDQRAAEERAKVVEWLRTKAIRAWGADASGADETTFAADAIERGEHHENSC